MSYGKLTVPNKDKPGVREIEIVDFVKSTFQDGREVSILGLQNEGVVIQIANPEESGRNPLNQMWLSDKSFFAMQTLAVMYYKAKGIDTTDAIHSVLDGDRMEYEFSPNLTEKINA